MGLLIDLLTLPISGPIKGVYWLAQQVVAQAKGEELDVNQVQAKLLELQVQLELDEITEAEFLQQEAALLEQLRLIQEGANTNTREGHTEGHGHTAPDPLSVDREGRE